MSLVTFRRFAALALASLLSLMIWNAAQAQTLDAIRDRGHVICGATDPSPGFAQQSEDGLWSGFDVDFCRAVAAAVFNDPRRVVFKSYSGTTRLAPLQVGEVDLLSRNGTWTIRRDSSYNVNFVGVSFFDGQAFMLPQNKDVVSAFELDNVRVCVLTESEQVANVRDFFFQIQATYQEIIYEDRQDLIVAYKAQICDVVSAPSSWLFAMRKQLDDSAMHRILPERISKDPMGPVVREGDAEWFEIVRWTLYVLIAAEELGVNSVNIGSMGEVRTGPIRRFMGLRADFGAPVGPGWLRIENLRFGRCGVPRHCRCRQR